MASHTDRSTDGARPRRLAATVAVGLAPILGVMFYVTVVPVGLLMRLFRDPLDRGLRDGRSSVWVRRTPKPFDRTTYENQF